MGKHKPVRLSGHARQQLRFRGASEVEVIESIQNSQWEKAERGRLECKKDFPYNSVWNKKYYSTKQVRPIFVEESEEIVVITVYVYYF